MSTTITTETSLPPSTGSSTERVVRRPRHRTLLAAVVAGALGIGAGAAAVSLTDSGGTSSRQAHSAPAASPKVDAQALWNDLSKLSSSEEANVVAGLTPSVRAQLRAVAEGYAVAAEHH